MTFKRRYLGNYSSFATRGAIATVISSAYCLILGTQGSLRHTRIYFFFKDLWHIQKAFSPFCITELFQGHSLTTGPGCTRIQKIVVWSVVALRAPCTAGKRSNLKIMLQTLGRSCDAGTQREQHDCNFPVRTECFTVQ